MVREFAPPLRTDDPDTPTEVVGALALPPIDLARLGLSPLGWLFVGGAALVAAMHLAWIGRAPVGVPVEELPASLLFAVAGVTICLLPAALLRRAPDAIRTHQLLLAGLATAAITEIVRAVVSFILPFGPEEGSWLRTVRDVGWPLLGPFGSVLVGLGLMRLRAGAQARFGLLAVVAMAYVSLILVPTLIAAATSSSTGSFDGLSATLILVIVPLTAAFAVWVPVSAWLDHDPARAFWGLLALALPVTVAMRALEIPEMVAVVAFRSNALFVAGTTFDAFAAAVIAVLALVAYGRLVPVTTAAE